MSNTQTTESGANLNTSNFGWHSTLSMQLARVAANQRNNERSADHSVDKFLGDVSREWRVMAKDVRFAFYGGVDSPERQRAYTARRIAEYRRSLVAYLHRPEMTALDEALEAVETEIAG
jgi:hypothetical protein